MERWGGGEEHELVETVERGIFFLLSVKNLFWEWRVAVEQSAATLGERWERVAARLFGGCGGGEWRQWGENCFWVGGIFELAIF